MDKGVFEIKGEINDIMAAMVVKQLLDFSDKNPKETITLYINSEGGKVTAGMAIYDVMRYIPNPVSTIASGKVAGIATLILAAGTPGMRYAYKESTVSFGLFFVNKDVQSIPPELNAVMHKIYSILAKHTKMWVEQIAEMADSENVLDAEQAIKAGLVDKVMCYHSVYIENGDVSL